MIYVNISNYMYTSSHSVYTWQHFMTSYCILQPLSYLFNNKIAVNSISCSDEFIQCLRGVMVSTLASKPVSGPIPIGIKLFSSYFGL